MAISIRLMPGLRVRLITSCSIKVPIARGRSAQQPVAQQTRGREELSRRLWRIACTLEVGNTGIVSPPLEFVLPYRCIPKPISSRSVPKELRSADQTTAISRRLQRIDRIRQAAGCDSARFQG